MPQTKTRALAEARSIDEITDAEVAEVLQTVAGKRDEIREVIALVYYKDGRGEVLPTNISLERASFLLQLLQEYVNSAVKRGVYDLPS